MEFPPKELLDNKSDSESRLVLDDWYRERGIIRTPLGVVIYSVDDAAAAADAAAADDDDDDDAAPSPHIFQMKDFDMIKNGLYLLRLRGGWYGRGIPVIGWMKHINGDWWNLLPGSRVIVRMNSDMTSISVLAGSGPTKNHTLQDSSKAVEIINVMGLLRIFEANEAAWIKHCPRPKDFPQE